MLVRGTSVRAGFADVELVLPAELALPVEPLLAEPVPLAASLPGFAPGARPLWRVLSPLPEGGQHGCCAARLGQTWGDDLR